MHRERRATKIQQTLGLKCFGPNRRTALALSGWGPGAPRPGRARKRWDPGLVPLPTAVTDRHRGEDRPLPTGPAPQRWVGAKCQTPPPGACSGLSPSTGSPENKRGSPWAPGSCEVRSNVHTQAWGSHRGRSRARGSHTHIHSAGTTLPQASQPAGGHLVPQHRSRSQSHRVSSKSKEPLLTSSPFSSQEPSVCVSCQL